MTSVGGWTNDDLAAIWGEVRSRVPVDVRDNVGVTYHGPDDDRPWVAWCYRDAAEGPAFGHEGWGDSPLNALRALAVAYANDSGWWHITSADPDGRGPA